MIFPANKNREENPFAIEDRCGTLKARLLLLFVSPLGKKAVARSHLRPIFLSGEPLCGTPNEA
jgi:hypothetical protein